MRWHLVPALLLAVVPSVAEGTVQDGAVEGTVSVERGRPDATVLHLVPDRDIDPEAPDDAVVVDQKDLRFIPQVVAVVPGTNVAFPNSDPMMHNVFSPPEPGDGFDLGTYPPSETRSHRFTVPGVHVILCHVHPEMVAYVAVVPSHHHVVADEEGWFEIRDVPPGAYTLRAWHLDLLETEREVVVGEGKTVRVDLHVER